MTYRIEISSDAGEQIRALPPRLAKQLAEVMTMLELTPWHTKPINDNNPGGSVRQFVFGDSSEAPLAGTFEVTG